MGNLISQGWYKSAKDNEKEPEKPENYDEMLDWFKKRTNKHIKLVQKYCEKTANYSDKYKGLIERGRVHDQSKFKDPELEPYVYTTWKYKCKDEGKDFKCPENINKMMDEATVHHISQNNRHHPEFHCGRKTDLINPNNRDKPPEEMVDGTKMKDLDLAEMCCDWMAVSEERGSSPKTWADNNVNIRWKFTDKQKDLIYELIDAIWE